MLLNLDKCEIETVVLGCNTDLNDGTHKKGTYSFLVENGRVKHVAVRLGEFYSKGPVFKGDIQINNKIFKSDQSFLPEVVLPEFENETSRWNDGVEINHQFIVNNIEYEFSWQSENLAPNYIGIEVQ